MKLTQTLIVAKSEMDAIKDLVMAAAKEFGEKLSMEDLNKHLHHDVRVKTTIGNMLTALNITDTYELEVELEIHDDVFIEIVQTFGEVLPMVSGIVRTMSSLNARMESRMEVLELEVNGEQQDVE